MKVTIVEKVTGNKAWFEAKATDPEGNISDIKVRTYLFAGNDFGRESKLAELLEWAKMMEQEGKELEKIVYQTKARQ